MVRRRMLGRLTAALATLAVLVASFVAIAPAESSQALSGDEFIPGLIIADSLFYDAAAMTEADVQMFLASKGSGLAAYTFTVASRPAVYSDTTGNLRCGAFTGGTNLPASTIIYRAQAACGISAKVILVTLQKEQGLITKLQPSQSAMDRAMGYACPDTAPCAPTTLGFGNQVYAGALQLNTYKQARFARQPGVQAIQYSPNAACGSSTINVQNYATAALYSYTPYQPNAAALANLNGTGDGCSSYGNRNFWVYYESWFGSTLGNEPYPVVSPGIIGNATLGTTLTANAGVWRGGPTLTYGWVSCTTAPDVLVDNIPDGCTAIPGAVAATYVSTSSDLGKYVAVMVTATNGYGAMTTGALLPARIGTPVNIAPPTISGSTTLGSTWTVGIGTWTGTPPPTMAIYWLRCTQPQPYLYTVVPSGCVAISGQNSASYVSTSADLGSYLTAQVAGNGTLGFALAGAVSTVAVGHPANSAPPTISGDTIVGSTLTVATGTWTGTPAPTMAIFWLRCAQPQTTTFTTVPAGCSAISGANATTYQPTLKDLGSYVTPQVAGNSPVGFALAGAISTSPIQSLTPTNTSAPTVSGAAAVGSTWTVNTGTWTGAPPPTMAIYWLRCSAAVTSVFTTVPSGCAAITGANATTYVSTSADVGKYLTAQVAGNSPVGFALAGAVSSTQTQNAAPTNTVAPTVSGSGVVGSTWTVSTGTWTGSPTIVVYWLRCSSPVSSGYTTVPSGCVAISGANANTYVSTSADLGKYLTAQVAGNSPIGFGLAGAVNNIQTH